VTVICISDIKVKEQTVENLIRYVTIYLLCCYHYRMKLTILLPYAVWCMP